MHPCREISSSGLYTSGTETSPRRTSLLIIQTNLYRESLLLLRAESVSVCAFASNLLIHARASIGRLWRLKNNRRRREDPRGTTTGILKIVKLKTSSDGGTHGVPVSRPAVTWLISLSRFGEEDEGIHAASRMTHEDSSDRMSPPSPSSSIFEREEVIKL